IICSGVWNSCSLRCPLPWWKKGSVCRGFIAVQPAVSSAIRKLEEEFEAPLFDRLKRHSFRLTRAGESLYRHARRILDLRSGGSAGKHCQAPCGIRVDRSEREYQPARFPQREHPAQCSTAFQGITPDQWLPAVRRYVANPPAPGEPDAPVIPR